MSSILGSIIFGIAFFAGYKIANYFYNKAIENGCNEVYEHEANSVEIGSKWIKPIYGHTFNDNPFNPTHTEEVIILDKVKTVNNNWWIQYKLTNEKDNRKFSCLLHNMFTEKWKCKE